MAGVIVVFPKPEDSKSIKNLLIHNGYDNVFSCATGSKAITLADTLGEGVIICGYRMPDMSYTDIYYNVEGRFEMLLVASRQKLLDDDTGVAMVEMPIKVRDFLNSVEMMQNNIYEKYRRKRKSPPKRIEEEQRIVDEAKAVLMQKNNMTENEAHRYIQKNAMDSGRTMVDTATSILQIMYKE